MAKSEKDTLYLGLCMAGAVSAGAYTAGVIDFLLEALEEWEKHRSQKDCPSHKVVIPAIGGASAGGMTGIITSTVVNNPVQPVKKLNGDIYSEHPENKLYHSWVDLLSRDMFPLMLKTNDINGNIYSLFNSQFIDDVAVRALQVDPVHRISRPYFDPKLKVFTTITNLKGFTYHTDMAGGHEDSAYYFSRHSDFAAFKLNDDLYSKDGWIPLDYFKNKNVEVARSAAMATGAFPVGLRARKLERESDHINQLQWNTAITGKWPLKPGKDSTLCVDGGVINNEPFYRVKDLLEAVTQLKAEGDEDISMAEVEERADSLSGTEFAESAKPILDQLHKTMVNGDQAALKKSLNKFMSVMKEHFPEQQLSTMENFSSTTLMIDPFPSEKKEDFKAEDGVLSVAGKTLSAMLSQIRLKPESLEQIYDQDNPDLFLIAPVRYEKAKGEDRKISGSRALACGFLGGFGGFIHKEFRVHDFFLGRANCERFLREYFTVPADTTNPIFASGYRDVTDKRRFMSADGKRLQMIPVFKEKQEPYMPVFESGTTWPTRKEKDVDRFSSALKSRLGKIIMNMGKMNWFSQSLLWVGNRILLRRRLSKTALETIKKDMKKWGLLN